MTQEANADGPKAAGNRTPGDRRPASTTRPSIPAVLRPSLYSVTRRTLTSAFARDRIINFCKFRTCFRSPAFHAVKIRCRKRRTSSSARPESTAAQSKTSSSGPFAGGVQLAPRFRRRHVIKSLHRLTRLTSAPFQAGAPALSGRLCGKAPAAGAGPATPGFPLPVRLPAFAS